MAAYPFAGGGGFSGDSSSDDAAADKNVEDQELEERLTDKRVAQEDANAEAHERGYFGSVPDPVPNSEHSLESGPDSPPLATDDRTRAEQPGLPRD